MTIRVQISNQESIGHAHNIRVHEVTFDGPLGLPNVKDGIIIKPGESREFVIWSTVKLAIEEEYDVDSVSLNLTGVALTNDQDPAV